LNVLINCAGLEDESYKKEVLDQAEGLRAEAEKLESEVMALTLSKIASGQP
jgi:formiminotetrahydrofolate cyclodeaminase